MVSIRFIAKSSPKSPIFMPRNIEFCPVSILDLLFSSSPVEGPEALSLLVARVDGAEGEGDMDKEGCSIVPVPLPTPEAAGAVVMG